MVTFLAIHNKKHRGNNYVLPNIYVLTYVGLTSGLIGVVSCYFLGILLGEITFIACSVIAIELSDTIILSMDKNDGTVNPGDIMLPGYSPPRSPGPRGPTQVPPVQRPNRPGLEEPSLPESTIPTSPLVIPSKSPSPMDTSPVPASPVKEDIPASPKETSPAPVSSEDMPAPPIPKPGDRFSRLSKKLYKEMSKRGDNVVSDISRSEHELILEAGRYLGDHYLTKGLLPDYRRKTAGVQCLLTLVAERLNKETK